MSYDRDFRVRAEHRADREDRDHNDHTLGVTVTDCDTEEETTLRIPAKYEVCSTCEGRGKHVNPSIDAHGISPDEFRDDPDFCDDYFSGVYDQTCGDCKGRTTILVPDADNMTDEQKQHYDIYLKQEADAARYDAEAAHERTMGY